MYKHMNLCGLRLTASAKFPHIKESELKIDPYLKSLENHCMSAVESGALDDFSTLVAVDLCQHIVNSSTRIIQDSIANITADWHRKAPRIYAHVNPDQCFFGINECDVAENLRHILPQVFNNASTTPERICCGSFNRLVLLFAKEVAEKVNSCISVVMRSNQGPPIFENFECNCIFYPTLNTMIRLLSRSLRCKRQMECQCTTLCRTFVRNFTTCTKEKPRRIVLPRGPCDIMCSTSNAEVMAIMAESTECWRWPKAVEDDRDYWYADSDDGLYDESSDTSSSDQSSEHSDHQSDQSSEHSDHKSDQSPEHTDHQPDDQYVLGAPVIDQSDQSPEHSDHQSDQSPVHTDQSDQSSEHTDTEERQSDNDNEKRWSVALLLVGLLLHTMKKARTTQLPQDVKRAIFDLTDEVLREINVANNIISMDHPSRKIYKALFEDLSELFGSANVLLHRVLMAPSQDLTYRFELILALKTYLTVPAPTPKKDAVVRFFSSLGKAIAKPFSCCFSGSSDSINLRK